jgi:hypothetical protein
MKSATEDSNAFKKEGENLSAQCNGKHSNHVTQKRLLKPLTPTSVTEQKRLFMYYLGES